MEVIGSGLWRGRSGPANAKQSPLKAVKGRNGSLWPRLLLQSQQQVLSGEAARAAGGPGCGTPGTAGWAGGGAGRGGYAGTPRLNWRLRVSRGDATPNPREGVGTPGLGLMPMAMSPCTPLSSPCAPEGFPVSD